MTYSARVSRARRRSRFGKCTPNVRSARGAGAAESLQIAVNFKGTRPLALHSDNSASDVRNLLAVIPDMCRIFDDAIRRITAAIQHRYQEGTLSCVTFPNCPRCSPAAANSSKTIAPPSTFVTSSVGSRPYAATAHAALRRAGRLCARLVAKADHAIGHLVVLNRADIWRIDVTAEYQLALSNGRRCRVALHHDPHQPFTKYRIVCPTQDLL